MALCSSVRLSQVGVLSKGMNGFRPICFFGVEVLSTSHAVCLKEIQVGYLQK